MKESRGGKQLVMEKKKRKKKKEEESNVSTMTQARCDIRRKTDLLDGGNWYLRGLGSKGRVVQWWITMKDWGQIIISVKNYSRE